MIDILGKRYIFFAISLVLIIPGLLIIAFSGLPLAIDFTGGSLVEVQFPGAVPAPAEVFTLYNELGVTDVQVTPSDDNVLIIRSSFMDEEQRIAISEYDGRALQHGNHSDACRKRWPDHW
jgi:preprotein translocase subunit SecF